MSDLKTEYVQLGDIRLAYCQNGNGRDLLLLHGNSGSKEFFKAYQLEHFPEFHTIAIDSRGHGKSRSKDKSLTYEQQSIDILEFCRARNIRNASLIGYSDGGNLALWLAIKAPDLFDKVVTLSPNTKAGGTTEGAMRAIQKAVKMMTWISKVYPPMNKNLMRFRLMLSDSGIEYEMLKTIQSKVLMLYAGKDMITEEHILEIVHHIPNVVVTKIEKASHLSLPFNDEAIQTMQQFLAV